MSDSSYLQVERTWKSLQSRYYMEALPLNKKYKKVIATFYLTIASLHHAIRTSFLTIASLYLTILRKKRIVRSQLRIYLFFLSGGNGLAYYYKRETWYFLKPRVSELGACRMQWNAAKDYRYAASV